MDELKIGSKFMKNLLSKLAKMAIRKKTGCNINIQVNGVHANMSDEKAHITSLQKFLNLSVWIRV